MGPDELGSHEVSRRSALKKGLVAGTLVWATPVVQTITAGPAFAAGSNPNSCHPAVSIKADFNDNPIAANDYIWFNAVVKLNDPKQIAQKLGTTKVTMSFVGQAIDFPPFPGHPTGIHFPLPNTDITWEGTGNAQTVSYSAGSWKVHVPLDFKDNVFAGGNMFKVPAGGIPAKLKGITWSGTWTMPGSPAKSQLDWKWAAAVYPSTIVFNAADPSSLQPKPIDGKKNNPYPNDDKAGTPEAGTIKTTVKKGARGNDGKTYTGDYSGSDTEKCPPTKK